MYRWARSWAIKLPWRPMWFAWNSTTRESIADRRVLVQQWCCRLWTERVVPCFAISWTRSPVLLWTRIWHLVIPPTTPVGQPELNEKRTQLQLNTSTAFRGFGNQNRSHFSYQDWRHYQCSVPSRRSCLINSTPVTIRGQKENRIIYHRVHHLTCATKRIATEERPSSTTAIVDIT